MIVVKIELWPGGEEAKKKLLKKMTITNIRSRRTSMGDYKVEVLNKHGKVARIAHVWSHRRKELSVWRLVQKALDATFWRHRFPYEA